MRKKTKPTANSTSHGAVEMIIRINNENVEVELLPPTKGEEDVKRIQEKEMMDAIGTAVDNMMESSIIEMDESNVESKDDIVESHQLNFEDSNASSSSDEKSRTRPPESVSPTSMEDRKLVHNKSEKHRRAQLKASMDKLKLLVPLEDSTQKYTTAALLRKAKYLIQKLEERERRNIVFKEQLQREQKYLRKRLDQIQQLQKDGFVAVGNTIYMSNTTPSASHHHPNPTRSQSFPHQGISGGSISGTSTKLPKYPIASTSSQVQVQTKTPPILKRKQNPEQDVQANTELIFIETLNSELNHPAAAAPSTGTTYELIATNSNEHYSINTNGLASENYCIIIDTDMMQEDYHPVTISNSTPSD